MNIYDEVLYPKLKVNDRVTVLTVRGNNLLHGIFVKTSAKGVTITMEGRERFIPGDNIEYIEKRSSAAGHAIGLPDRP